VRPTRFTKKEIVVFYGMVSHPEMNDHELSELLKERISTITSIRRRLKERGFFRKIRVPIIYNLGCELLVVSSGQFTPKPIKTSFVESLKNPTTTTVFSLCGNHDCLSLGVAKDYSTARCNIDNLMIKKEFGEAIEPRSWVVNYMPFGVMTDLVFFDFEPMVRAAFDISTDDPRYKTIGATREILQLKDSFSIEEGARIVERMSRIERKVFLGLFENPELPDKGVAEKIKVSRQAISKMRKKFEDMALLRDAVIPNLSMLDLDLFVITRYDLGSGMTEKERVALLRRIKTRVPYFILFGTKDLVYGITAFKSFETFEAAIKDINNYIEDNGLPVTMPMAMPFSTIDIRYISSLDLLPVVRELLGFGATPVPPDAANTM